jgi:hypothetical protein
MLMTGTAPVVSRVLENTSRFESRSVRIFSAETTAPRSTSPLSQNYFTNRTLARSGDLWSTQFLVTLLILGNNYYSSAMWTAARRKGFLTLLAIVVMALFMIKT